MLEIPLLPVSSQTLQTTLDDQTCNIAVYLLNAGAGTTGIEPDASSTEVTADTTQYTADLDTTIAGALNSQLYIDLTVDQQPVITCRPLVIDIPVLANATYYGVTGDFVIIDTQGDSQPLYTGLGTRWLLIYLEPSDLAAAA